MTDQQIIERLAEFMGWEKEYTDCAICWLNPYSGTRVKIQDWNPIEDWNHTMQVIEKFIQYGTIEFAFQKGEFLKMQINDVYHESQGFPFQRAFCLALVSASHI